MRDSIERDLAVTEELGHMADARIKELEQTCANLRQVVRMCLQQFEFIYGKRKRGWDAQYLMARCHSVLGTADPSMINALKLRKELDPDAPDEVVMRCEDEPGLMVSTCKRCGANCFGFLCAECLR